MESKQFQSKCGHTLHGHAKLILKLTWKCNAQSQDNNEVEEETWRTYITRCT